jgi:hypothetical protein
MAYKIRGRRLSNGLEKSDMVTIVTVDDPVRANQILHNLALQNFYYDLKAVETKPAEKGDDNV